ncbi:hypothetical protein M501DRAFT_986510 [Patellaria atrata CBS 101060]|uniref:Uncharacterized protein n=1 Tax=Patellaria atrata CBS 101060 TaxID=1346257 RepID=A0A9P4S6V5_9PEZI|nr:hypothetical protein M501DRAFT_986510 [Patellaria atrata CBS 101060]
MAESPFLNDEPLLFQQSLDHGPDTGIEKPQHNPHNRQQPNFYLYMRWLGNGWFGELVAVLSSCALVIALCVILKKYDGQPLLSFGSFFNSSITLGTLVSSRASRGLTSSVQLLWKLRLTPTASFAATLAIVHLAITPLAQQSLLSLSVPVVDLDGMATIPVAKDWFEPPPQTWTPNMSFDYTAISSGMKGAIFNGFFTSTNVTILDTVPTCTTGDCTFPGYQSLALCASSADVTAHLRNLSTEEEGRWCLSGSFCASTRGSIYRTPAANITSAVTQANTEAGRKQFYIVT